MAPPLLSRIRSTIRSHRPASWFLFATLLPFFLPFLILCMPIVLMFLAPVSVCLFPLLLLYKVKVFLFSKLKGFRGRADKGVGYQTSRQIAAAEGLNIHQQAPYEEVKGLEVTNVESAALEEVEGLEDLNAQSVVSHIHDDKEEDEVDSCILPSRVGEFEQEKLGLPEEQFAVQDGNAEDKIEERQLEQGFSVDEGRERSRQEGSPEYEELKVSDVQNVELPSFVEAQGEEGLQRPERERDFIEGALEDTGKELPQKDRMQDDKQEKEEATPESIYLKDEQKQAERESEFSEGALLLPSKDRMQDDKQEEEEATQESIDLRDQQKQPERESDKQEEEEATQESIYLKDQQEQSERESDFTEGILEHMGRELPQKDMMEDDKEEEKEVTQESIYLKDEQKEPEREHDFTEGTLEHTGKELPHIDRMEDENQEEEEATKESIDLKDEKKQHERESEFTGGTLEDTRKELPHTGRMEDDKQEEETSQESIDLKNKQRQPERENEFTEGTLEDVGKELPQKDEMEDSKQEEEQAIQESIDSKDEQEKPSLHVDPTSSHTSEEFRPLTDEHESFDKPFGGDHQSSVPVDWQGPKSAEDFSEKQESSHVHQFEEASSRLPSVEAEGAAFPEQIVERPSEELSEQFGIDTPAAFEHTREEPELSPTSATHEHTREEPELSSKEDSSSEILDNKGGLDKQEDVIYPAEPFEKETVEGEPSYRLPESHGQLRREPFAEETKDDEQSQTGKPAKDVATSFEAEVASEREESYPSEATSSVVPSPHESHEGVPFAEETKDEEQPQTGKPAKELATSFEAEAASEREEGYPSEAPSSVVPSPHASHEGVPFAEETIDDEQPQTGKPAKDLATSFEAEAASEREEGYSSEATSSVVPSPHESHEGVPFSEETKDDEQPQTGKPAKDLATSFEAEAASASEEGYPSEATSSVVPLPHESHEGVPFAEETKDDEQPQTGKPAKDLATSFEAEAASEREEGYPSEATSSVVPLPHESHKGIEFQDRTREEQKIINDIITIKKIVGYQGEPHASILDQIRALYLFLGMEPYDWAADVDDLERAQAEIELLKVVVGVK